MALQKFNSGTFVSASPSGEQLTSSDWHPGAKFAIEYRYSSKVRGWDQADTVKFVKFFEDEESWRKQLVALSAYEVNTQRPVAYQSYMRDAGYDPIPINPAKHVEHLGKLSFL